MIVREEARWGPLGAGRIAPQGTLAERALPPGRGVADRIAAYKRQVAGRYRSVSPADLATALPPGPHVLSPKIDGETWFLEAAGGKAWLLSPTGRVIADVPATAEAARLLPPGRGVAGRDVLLAGELHANGCHGRGRRRPRVHDLHALLGPHRAEGSTVTTRMNEVSTGFHDYGVMMEPDFITMYFDGVKVWKTKTPLQHNKPLMLLLNLALGSGWPIDKTPNPSYMYVDHVRAYAKK